MVVQTCRLMITTPIQLYLILANFYLLIHFILILPTSVMAIDLTSVIALTSDLNTGNIVDRNTTLKADGAVCVFNGDCSSGCCIYANSASGMCVDRAGVGQVCGFVYGAHSSLESHYRICQNCDTNCCCGTACCPTDYCSAALQLKSHVCTTCNTGCCCNNTCCPLTFCVSTGELKENSVKGKLCLRCQSGCCCGDSCCVSSFCKGSVVGKPCLTCATGCCCDNNICCPSSFCADPSALSVARQLLAMFDTSSRNQAGWSVNAAPDVSSTALGFPVSSPQHAPPLDTALPPSLFPVLAPASQRILGGGFVGAKTKAYLCIECTTGCCCEVGCCSYIYCTS